MIWSPHCWGTKSGSIHVLEAPWRSEMQRVDGFCGFTFGLGIARIARIACLASLFTKAVPRLWNRLPVGSFKRRHFVHCIDLYTLSCIYCAFKYSTFKYSTFGNTCTALSQVIHFRLFPDYLCDTEQEVFPLHLWSVVPSTTFLKPQSMFAHVLPARANEFAPLSSD